MHNIKQKLGKTVLARIESYELDESLEQALQNGYIGGVVLFSQNVKDLDQLTRLISKIYEISFHYPLIACDQEGGAVDRFFQVLTPMPSPLSLASQDISVLKEVITNSLNELKLIGINCVLAPVLDINNSIINPIIATRSYGDTPEIVVKYATAYLECAKNVGLLAVAKHFPGHGSTIEDSHLELAVNAFNIDIVRKIDLDPYFQMNNKIDSIMMSHVYYPSLEPKKLPASISNNCYKYLKEIVEFNGIVMTDDMTMGAISKNFGSFEASLMALSAGANYLMLLDSSDKLFEIIDKLACQIQKDSQLQNLLEISNTKIDNYFNNIAKIKTSQKPSSQILKHNYAINFQAARNGLVLLKGKLPDIKNIDLIIYPKHNRYNFDFVSRLKNNYNLEFKKDFSFVEYNYDLSQDFDNINLEHFKDKHILIALYRPIIYFKQFELFDLLKAKARGVNVVIFDMPYGYSKLTNCDMLLSCLDSGDLACEAICSVLINHQPLEAKMPLKFLT